MTETITPPSVDVAARAIDASKIYGSGEAEVRALDAINVQMVGQVRNAPDVTGAGPRTMIGRSCVSFDRFRKARLVFAR